MARGATDHVGVEIRTDREVEPVREAVIPLSALAGATVQRRWRWPPGHDLVLTAADLRVPALEGAQMPNAPNTSDRASGRDIPAAPPRR